MGYHSSQTEIFFPSDSKEKEEKEEEEKEEEVLFVIRIWQWIKWMLINERERKNYEYYV